MTKPLAPEKKRAKKDHPWRKQFPLKTPHNHEKTIPYHARMGINR